MYVQPQSVLEPILLLILSFNRQATTEIYTLSLHDALPISRLAHRARSPGRRSPLGGRWPRPHFRERRSEEHTSELQSHHDLVCRLLLEKKKKNGLDSLGQT